MEGIEIGVLVNNVGISGGGINHFHENEIQDLLDLITVNITAATALCHGLIPPMLNRGRGAVINIGSVLGHFQGAYCQYLAPYCASKHYIRALTEALAEEYKDTSLVFQEVHPGLVKTSITEGLPSTPMMPSAFQCVSWSLASLGWTLQTCGYWAHYIILPFYTTLPVFMDFRKAYQSVNIQKNKTE